MVALAMRSGWSSAGLAAGSLVAGSLAGATGQAMVYPLDRARAVLAVTKAGDYRNLLEVFRRIIKEEGITAIYRGFVPTMLGVIPYAGSSFYCYEMQKKYWTQRGNKMSKVR